MSTILGFSLINFERKSSDVRFLPLNDNFWIVSNYSFTFPSCKSSFESEHEFWLLFSLYSISKGCSPITCKSSLNFLMPPASKRSRLVFFEFLPSFNDLVAEMFLFLKTPSKYVGISLELYFLFVFFMLY